MELIISPLHNSSSHRLENFPPVYYINLDSDTVRKSRVESQFDSYGVKYTRVPAHDGRTSNLAECLTGHYPPDMSSKEVGASLSHLKAIRHWYCNSDSDHAMICEDDVSFETVNYWPFDWNTVVRNLPYDWEIFQAAVINVMQISVNLHHRYVNDFSTAAYLIKRDYAKRLLSYHVIGDKYKLDNGVRPRAVADDLVYNAGRAYAMPLFLYDVELESTIHTQHVATYHKICYDATLKFWKETGSKMEDYSSLFDYDPFLGRLPVRA
jgi:GR25 family glycosyltransferase involved in LPS biosynthesis